MLILHLEVLVGLLVFFVFLEWAPFLAGRLGSSLGATTVLRGILGVEATLLVGLGVLFPTSLPPEADTTSDR